MKKSDRNETNVMSILGFVLSFFLGIPGLICSIIGLSKSKELKNGKGLSIAGIIISSIRIAFITMFTIIMFFIVLIEASTENSNNNLVGDWEPYRLEKYGEEVPLQEYYGTCIQYGGYITFYDNSNTLENKVGCYSEEDNNYHYYNNKGETYYLDGDDKIYIDYVYLEKDQSYIVINKNEYRIYFRKRKTLSTKTDQEKAQEILYNQFGEYNERTSEKYLYSYLGIYKSGSGKEFYVFDLESIEEDNLITVGYYAVSLENEDYYFINNAPEFLETGIIYIEPKVIIDE